MASDYKRIHKRFNPQGYVWEEFEPDAKDPVQGVAFNFIINQSSNSLRARPSPSKVVEVVSQSLRRSLKRCLPFIDTAVDDDLTSPFLEVDARTLAAHEDVLQLELLELQNKFTQLQEAKEGRQQTTKATAPADDSTPVDDGADMFSVEIDELRKLLSCLKTEFESTKRRFEDLVNKNAITFDLLWFLFRQGRIITFRDPASELKIAGRVTGSHYQTTHHEKMFTIIAQYIDYNGDALFYRNHAINIISFPTHTRIDLLAAQPLEDAGLKDSLISRGRAFVQLRGKHYLQYHDFLLTRGTFGQLIKFRALGRAMVDAPSYRQMYPQGDDGYRPPEGDKLLEVSEDELVLCASTVPGYSFVTKRWGLLLAEKFTPVVWSKGAFDHLVIPTGIKQLIQSLVRANRQTNELVKDVIAGKGGGCVIVLHGRPGTGKTLTAEAVAEEQEKPLLKISVGDLGRDASQLESKLTEFFELAALWDAVMLFDEADILMEARSLNELKRNAMVGVFLKLLEYHQQIMFLSTNRITTFDDAFKSRISVAIQYPDLDKSARRTVWENFLRLAGVHIVTESPVDAVSYVTTQQLDKLASKSLNGREIKNIMRTAQALAHTSAERLGYDLIVNVLNTVEQYDAA